MSLHLYLPVFPSRRPSPEQSIDGTMTITGTNIWMDVLFLTADSLYLILLVAKRRYLLLTGTIQSVFFSFYILLFLQYVIFSPLVSPSLSDPKEMHCHENWSLSPEEFEIWDRLYRLKENDGVKEPMLPHTRFETLENLDKTSVSLTST